MTNLLKITPLNSIRVVQNERLYFFYKLFDSRYLYILLCLYLLISHWHWRYLQTPILNPNISLYAWIYLLLLLFLCAFSFDRSFLHSYVCHILYFIVNISFNSSNSLKLVSPWISVWLIYLIVEMSANLLLLLSHILCFFLVVVLLMDAPFGNAMMCKLYPSCFCPNFFYFAIILPFSKFLINLLNLP